MRHLKSSLSSEGFQISVLESVCIMLSVYAVALTHVGAHTCTCVCAHTHFLSSDCLICPSRLLRLKCWECRVDGCSTSLFNLVGSRGKKTVMLELGWLKLLGDMPYLALYLLFLQQNTTKSRPLQSPRSVPVYSWNI